MNKTAISLALAGMAALPAIGQAREINLSTTLKDYRGNEAYLAIYVTDAQGAYQRTLWVAGKRPSTTSTCVTGPRAVAVSRPSSMA